MFFSMWIWFLYGARSLAWTYICERLSSKFKLLFSIYIYGGFRESLRIFGPRHYVVGQLWIEYFLLMERQKNDYWEYIIEVNRMLFRWAKLRLFYISHNMYRINGFQLDPKTYSDFNLGELISSFKKEPSGWAGNEKLFRTLIYDALNKDPSKRYSTTSHRGWLGFQSSWYVSKYNLFSRPSATQFLQHLNSAAVAERKRRNAQTEHEAQTTPKRSPKEADILRPQPFIQRGYEFLKSIFQ